MYAIMLNPAPMTLFQFGVQPPRLWVSQIRGQTWGSGNPSPYVCGLDFAAYDLREFIWNALKRWRSLHRIFRFSRKPALKSEG